MILGTRSSSFGNYDVIVAFVGLGVIIPLREKIGNYDLLI